MAFGFTLNHIRRTHTHTHTTLEIRFNSVYETHHRIFTMNKQEQKQKQNE